MDDMKEIKCCICGTKFIGWGNNPEPVKKKGRCCNNCNRDFVIPARIAQLIQQGKRQGNP